jgi:hypothetical protein
MTRHSAILTNLVLSLSLATGLLYAAPSASAQTSETATIPFAFSADHQQFPAGTYEVRCLPDGIMSLRNLDTGRTQLLMVRVETGSVVETRGRLVFHLSQTENTLMQVWVPGTTVHSELTVQPKLQRLVAKNGPPVSTSEVAMK